jgi:hypothetical protein
MSGQIAGGIATLLFILLLVFGARRTARRSKVQRYRFDLTTRCSNWNRRHAAEIRRGEEKPAERWLMDHVADSGKMLNSFKALKDEKWLTPQMIEKLKT